jgi:CxxC motif-containing protein (DUF1111 family)
MTFPSTGLRPALFFVVAVLTGPCLAWELKIQPQTEISWNSVSGNSYLVQFSTQEAPGTWSDLGSPTNGSGALQAANDPVRTGLRTYRVMETVPGSGEVLVQTNALSGDNPGFESGSSGWSLGSVHSISTMNAHSGTSFLRSFIPGGATGAQLVKTLPSVLPGTVYNLSFWAKQISAGPSYVQHYQIEWLAADGAVTTAGWVNFSGGNGSWAKISAPSATAPANAASARLVFYFATGAVAGAMGEVWLDDVAFEFLTSGGPSVLAQIRQISSTNRPVLRLSWPSIAGVSYQPEQNSSLQASGWSPVSAPLAGNGSELSLGVPTDGIKKFFRVVRPILQPAAPANLRLEPTGIRDSLTVAWDPSPSPGVLGYRLLYGTSPGNLDQSIDLGLVPFVTLPGLTPNQTYYLTVIAYSVDGNGPIGTSTLASQPETEPAFQPLFTASTPLQPDPVIETSTAKITHLADRARDRHAREGIGFLLRDGPAVAAAYKYDHYLSFYWEQRVAQIEIIDEVAKGGSKVVFNFTTQVQLNPAEFRTFFNINSPLSGYHNNQSDYLNAGVTLVSSNPSTRYPGETDFNYTATVNQKFPENRPLQLGDRMEIELSQFLLNPRNGRNNYYGTTFLYVVGRGIVPWYAKDWEAATNKVVGVTSFDSYALPEETWLGGLTTLPYQYSNEPEHRFKQMAGNISSENGQPYMLGRRIHHTDFLTGAHSEPGNPVFTNHAGKVGPQFVTRSCVACHVNNGRSLLPPVGSVLSQAVVKVGSSADGAHHPVLGEQLHPFSTTGAPEAGVTLSGFTESSGAYGDGTPYTLRKPQYQFSGVAPSYYSVRTAPPLVGMGLLEAVPESAIIALADPNDSDGNGISGRVNYVRDPTNASALRLGRFTPKANQAKVVHQIAYALNRDMGVTSSLFPILDGETSPRPAEISSTELDQLNRYVALLGVGAQRNFQDPEVVRGKQLFTSASCIQCHTPTLTTSPYHPMGELRNQTIHPYTDLLLHDMGPGLADNMAEEGVSASEWRTAPLWSLGLSAGVSGGEGYLHDGRARTIEEAILWHGGEAEAAKENFRTMPAADRAALVKFLKSL